MFTFQRVTAESCYILRSWERQREKISHPKNDFRRKQRDRQAHELLAVQPVIMWIMTWMTMELSVWREKPRKGTTV